MNEVKRSFLSASWDVSTSVFSVFSQLHMPADVQSVSGYATHEW